MEKIGFGPRFIAGFIDGLILLIPMYLVYALFGIGFMYAILTAAIAGGYTYLDVSRAQTIGKKTMGIKILSGDGNVAAHDVLLKRWGLKFAPTLLNTLAVITGIGFIGTFSMLASLVLLVGCFMTLGVEKLALHDRIAGTAVYKVQAQPA